MGFDETHNKELASSRVVVNKHTELFAILVENLSLEIKVAFIASKNATSIYEKTYVI